MAGSPTSAPASTGLVDLFRSSVVVMLGEPAPSRQLGLLLQRLVPHLHAAGVHHLGIWWALADDQTDLDRLVTGPSYDPDGACRIVHRRTARTGDDFAEYIDVVRATWAFNQQRPDGTAPMLLLGLDAELDLDAVTERADLTQPAAWPHLRPRGSLARRSGELLTDLVTGSGGRVLAVVPTTHALTATRRPAHPAVDRVDVEVRDGRVMGMGNYLFAALGDRVTTVLVHGPLPGPPDGPAWCAPSAIGVDIDGLEVPALVRAADAGRSWASAWLVVDRPDAMRAPTPVRGLVHDGNIKELRRRALDPTLRAVTSSPADFDARLTARVHDATARWRIAAAGPR
jgi:hypothetical protein